MRYNQNTGNRPKIDDRVKICHTDSELDGMNGNIIGFSDISGHCGILLMDNSLKDGSRAITIPFVCLVETQEDVSCLSPMDLMIKEIHKKVSVPCEYGHSDIGDVFITYMQGGYTYEEAMEELSYF